MYSSSLCSLQEAYSVPTFDSPAKKKKSCAPSPQKASADPYDPYVPENGRGEFAAFREGFQSGPDKPYRGIVGDYNFYRKEYGLDTPKLTEPFTEKVTQKPESCTSSPQRYDFPLSDADKKRYNDAMNTALSQDQKQTLHPPAEMRKTDMKTVQGYIDDDLENYLQTKDMKAAPFTVTPTPIKKQDLQAEPYDPDASPFAKALTYFKGQLTPIAASSPSEHSPSTPNTSHYPSTTSWSQFWDIIMFVFAGLLVLFLCEQLFKLAILIGMKRTVVLLEPYLLQHVSEQS